MREILFRGKTTEGKWVYGDLFHRNNEVLINNYHEGFNLGVIPETVGQYIGEDDKNGKKIFEGDIINVEHCEAWVLRDSAIYDSPNIAVEWVGTFNGFEPFISYGHNSGIYLASRVEVVGNIHDNPELLKGGAE